MKNNDLLTERIIGCCFNVHRELGPGFNERIYHNALQLSLIRAGLEHQNEKEFNVFYQNKQVGNFRVDLVVENKVIVEIKSLSGNLPTIFASQLLSYLKASKLHVGLLVNFGNKSCQIKRLVF